MASGEKKPLPAAVIARYTLVVVGIIAVALFFWQIKQALLIALAGVIVAVIITGMARGLRRVLPLSRGWSLAGAGLEVVLVIGLFILLFGSQIVQEVTELTQKLPEQISELQQTIQGWPMSEHLMDGAEEPEGNDGGEENQEAAPEQDEGETGDEENQEAAEQDEGETGGEEEEDVESPQGAGGMLLQAGATVIDVLATLALVLFVGIFFAVDPDLYKNGILLLVTKDRTERVGEALDASGHALWNWLMGQLISMTFVGVTVAVGLWIAGVPLALVLGVIAGLLDFVPYIGPIVAVVPGILLAFAEGPQTALWAALVYLIAQQLEGYVVTPMVQQSKVNLPPGIVILAVVAFGLVFGIPGVVLAAPLAVLTMVLVGMLYVQDVLGKDIEIPGQG